jgi:hypothetical protein
VLPSTKLTYHALDEEPAKSGVDADQKEPEGVEGKYVGLMLGLSCPKSTMDESSMSDGRRQSL